MEVGVEAVRDLMQPRQNGAVVLGAEHHAVHLVRSQFVARDLVREQGIAGEDIPFREAVQQPFGVVLDRVRAPACIEYHGCPPVPTVPFMGTCGG